ncbi:MAG: transposase, partial [Myxococcaceae bacterium]
DVVELVKHFEASPKLAMREVVNHFRQGVGETLERVMKAELELFLGQEAELKNKRNGFSVRTYSVKGVGALQVRVPRDRASRFDSRVVPKGRRYDEALEQDLALLHLAGLSTRMLSHVSRHVLGIEVSPSEVSNALKTIVPAAKTFLSRPLAGRRFKYLYVDGTFFSVRRTTVEREPTLVVIGVDEADKKSILAMVQGDKDSRMAWEMVFNELKERGLDGSAVHTDEDVQALLHKVALRTVALLRDAGKLDDAEPQEDALDFLRAQSTRTKRLPFLEWTPPRNGRRCAFLEGFSLHANSRVHENDRQGLLRLANYGARGPFSLERLSQLPNGDLAYRMKRPSASGAHVLVLSPLALLRKLAALVPPPRVNLVRFFGVFAPNARVRKRVVPKTTTKDDMPAVGCHDSGEFAESMGHTPTRPKRTSRIPWAQLLKRTFAKDVLACDKCGGERRIVAYVTAQATVREILRHLGLPSQALPQARAQDSPQLELYA